jgi:hypothetical protein
MDTGGGRSVSLEWSPYLRHEYSTNLLTASELLMNLLKEKNDRDQSPLYVACRFGTNIVIDTLIRCVPITETNKLLYYSSLNNYNNDTLGQGIALSEVLTLAQKYTLLNHFKINGINMNMTNSKNETIYSILETNYDLHTTMEISKYEAEMQTEIDKYTRLLRDARSNIIGKNETFKRSIRTLLTEP